MQRENPTLQSKNNPFNNLIQQLEKKFPVQHSNESPFGLFPLCNEIFFFDTLIPCLNKEIQNQLPEAKPNQTIKVAILFGESHFISILPELAKLVNVIIMADIHPKLHQHTKHLYFCLQQANNPDDYINQYNINHPFETTSDYTIDNCRLDHVLREHCTLYGEKYFLHNEKRYQECQSASKQVKVIHLNFNVMDIGQCYILRSILQKDKAEIKFANFTNIAEYNLLSTMLTSLPILLQHSPNAMIMHSKRKILPESLQLPTLFFSKGSQVLPNYVGNRLTHLFKIFYDLDSYIFLSDIKKYNRIKAKVQAVSTYRKIYTEIIHKLNQQGMLLLEERYQNPSQHQLNSLENIESTFNQIKLECRDPESARMKMKHTRLLLNFTTKNLPSFHMNQAAYTIQGLFRRKKAESKVLEMIKTQGNLQTSLLAKKIKHR